MRRSRVTFEDVWPDLSAGVQQLIRSTGQGLNPEAHMKLYSKVHDYCSSRRTGRRQGTGQGANFIGEQLYYELEGLLKRHMAELHRRFNGVYQPIPFLELYVAEWNRYTLGIRAVNSIFAYLNRHWIPREQEDDKRKVYMIRILGLVLWRDHLFTHIKKDVTSALLHLIASERRGDYVPRTLIQGVTSSYVSLGINPKSATDQTLEVYQADFEQPFLEATRVFFAQEASIFVAENHISDYMRKVHQRLEEEEARVVAYLHHSSLAAVIRVIENVFMESHMHVMQDEFQALLAHDKVDDMRMMHQLLCRVEHGLEPLTVTLEAYIESQGLGALSTIAEAKVLPSNYVETVLRVWRKYNTMVNVAFDGDAAFVAALDRACRRFVNDNAVCAKAGNLAKSPELVARFCDKLLKTGSHKDEQDVDATLTDIMIVFKYIREKDVFLTFYSKMLAKRLISASSASDDLETSMLARLKATCGFEYTSKLQRMFQDVQRSRDMCDSFVDTLEAVSSGTSRQDATVATFGFDFGVMVLATGSWPLQAPQTDFTLPPSMQAAASAFRDFYGQQHTGRKLTWLHQLAKGEMRTRYLARTYSVQCSTFQLGILLEFNDSVEQPFQHLQAATLLSEKALCTSLWGLVKAKVLLMKPAPKSLRRFQVSNDASFVLNMKFKSKRLKVNVNLTTKAAKRREIATTNEEVEEDRKLAIQAAIVRIMKSRRALMHTQLIAEVVQQLSSAFQPRIPLIKKCIDILIEKEYCARDEANRQLYHYVA